MSTALLKTTSITTKLCKNQRAFCCTTVASRTQPILKLTPQLQSITSVTRTFLLIHVLPQAGHVHTFVSPKMLQMKPTSSKLRWLW